MRQFPEDLRDSLKTIQAIATVLDSSPELDSKTLWLKIPHTYFSDRTWRKRAVLIRKLPHHWLALIGPEGAP